MENAKMILQQILVMFLYMALGFVLYKTKMISKEGSKSFSNFLIYAILPCMIVDSFCIQRTAEKTSALLLAAAAGAASLAISAVIGALVFRKRPLDNFAATFSNAGFMGIPIITAVLGLEGAFYIAPLIAFLNCLQYTYGQALLAGTKDAMRPLAIVKSPLVIACVLGVVLYLTGVGDRIPRILDDTLSTLSGLTGPVAMVLLGVYIGEMDLKTMATDLRAWLVSGVRLLLIPVVTLFAFLLIPDHDIALAVMIASAAPVGANAAIYAQKLDCDYVYACRTVCQSTLLSVVTMPLMILLSEAVWAAL